MSSTASGKGMLEPVHCGRRRGRGESAGTALEQAVQRAKSSSGRTSLAGKPASRTTSLSYASGSSPARLPSAANESLRRPLLSPNSRHTRSASSGLAFFHASTLPTIEGVLDPASTSARTRSVCGGRAKDETEPAVEGEVQAGLREGERAARRSAPVICRQVEGRGIRSRSRESAEEKGEGKRTHGRLARRVGAEQVAEALDGKAAVRLAAVDGRRDVEPAADLALRERVHVLREVVQQLDRLGVRVGQAALLRRARRVGVKARGPVQDEGRRERRDHGGRRAEARLVHVADRASERRERDGRVLRAREDGVSTSPCLSRGRAARKGGRTVRDCE